MKENNQISQEQIELFFDWLQGKDCPAGYEFTHKLSLTPQEAFCILYYLQEELKVLSDTYEMCRACHSLYDSDNEGTSIDEDSTVIIEHEEVAGNFPEESYGHYCDACRPD